MLRNYLDHLFAINYTTTFRFQEREDLVNAAEEAVLRDYHYHYAQTPKTSLLELLALNEAWLSVFLYRFGRGLYLQAPEDPLLKELHRLLRIYCSMEIYFSVAIGEGFEVRHGLGTVIGSRCSIGKGFIVHQGCTVGHRVKYGNGPQIGNNVEMGATSSVLGEISVGDNVVIAAHGLVLGNVPAHSVVTGVYK